MECIKPEIILYMGPANERWRYMVTSSLIGWVHIQNDPCNAARLSSIIHTVIAIHQSLMIIIMTSGRYKNTLADKYQHVDSDKSPGSQVININMSIHTFNWCKTDLTAIEITVTQEHWEREGHVQDWFHSVCLYNVVRHIAQYQIIVHAS